MPSPTKPINIMGKKECFRHMFALPKEVEMLLLRKGDDSGHWFANALRYSLHSAQKIMF